MQTDLKPHYLRPLLLTLLLVLVPGASAATPNDECLVQLSTTLVVTIHSNGTWLVTTEWVDYQCIVEGQDNYT